MSPATEQAKAALLLEHTKQVKLKHPRWSFSQCWAAAEAANPSLREEYEGEATTAAQPVFRYTETGKHFSPRSVKPSFEDFGSQKVWAKKEKPNADDGELMLVYASDGRLVGLELEHHG